MSRTQNGTRPLKTLIRNSNNNPSTRKKCRRNPSPRTYASIAAATAKEQDDTLSLDNHTTPVAQANTPVPTYRVKAGVILSRAPIITRDLTPFEKAFYVYQRRLNERLALPFTRYFYFQKGTPSDFEWKRKIRERTTPARDIGRYNPYSKDGWNDELLIGATESEPDYQLEAILKDAEVPAVGQEHLEDAARIPVEGPMPRVTEADKAGDEKSLDRKLDRNLYLVVKGKEGNWTFPSASIAGKESLVQAAERIIVQSGGANMNTWVIGNHPIGHMTFKYGRLGRNDGVLGEKTFFMRSRIMAGQANLKDNRLGLLDFRWLCREELQSAVGAHYWNAVRGTIAEQ